MNRLGQSFFNAPVSAINTAQYGAVFNPKLSRPLGYSLGFSIKSNQIVSALIRHLLLHSRPSAVSKLVVPVVVDPVDGELIAVTLSNVGKKVREVLPSLAHLNTAPAVYRIFVVIRILASRLHIAPAIVCARRLLGVASIAYAMLEVSTSRFFVSRATAGHGQSFYERLRVNGFCFSALANAVPISLAVLSVCLRNNRPTTELLTSKVFDSAHSVPRMLCTLTCAWQASVQMLFGSYPSHAKRIIS